MNADSFQPNDSRDLGYVAVRENRQAIRRGGQQGWRAREQEKRAKAILERIRRERGDTERNGFTAPV